MRTQHARRFSRRRFLGGLTLAGSAGLLGVHPKPVAAESPPETTRIRLVQTPSMCQAPQYVAEELLRGEGFTDVVYVKKEGPYDIADELGMRPLQAHCHRGLGTLYSQIGRVEQARAELSTARELYRAMDMTSWLPETEATLARVEGR